MVTGGADGLCTRSPEAAVAERRRVRVGISTRTRGPSRPCSGARTIIRVREFFGGGREPERVGRRAGRAAPRALGRTGAGCGGRERRRAGRAATRDGRGRETPPRRVPRGSCFNTRAPPVAVSDFQWNPFDPWTIRERELGRRREHAADVARERPHPQARGGGARGERKAHDRHLRRQAQGRDEEGAPSSASLRSTPWTSGREVSSPSAKQRRARARYRVVSLS